MTMYQGSPPLTRGKAAVGINSGWIIGITPAYAGKSKHLSFVVILHEDHPRLRGEK